LIRPFRLFAGAAALAFLVSPVASVFAQEQVPPAPPQGGTAPAQQPPSSPAPQAPVELPKPDPAHRYRRPYEGTEVAEAAMQAYLEWEYGLVAQLRRDATHGFYVI